MWSWTERGLDQLASLCRDVERMNAMERTDVGPGFITPRVLESEPIPPRVRVNVKRLANGQWQPDITVERYDADPLTIDGRVMIHDSLINVERMVAEAIAAWEETATNGN